MVLSAWAPLLESADGPDLFGCEYAAFKSRQDLADPDTRRLPGHSGDRPGGLVTVLFASPGDKEKSWPFLNQPPITTGRTPGVRKHSGLNRSCQSIAACWLTHSTGRIQGLANGG